MSYVLKNMNYDLDPELEDSLFMKDDSDLNLGDGFFIKAGAIEIKPTFYRTNVKVGIKLEDDGIMPSYANDGDSGADLFVCFDTVIPANARGYIVNTNVRLDIPYGWEVQIRPKSGVSCNTPLRVVLGTVDSGYKGVIAIIVDNLSDEDISIPRGKAIAQMVLQSVPMMMFEERDELSTSERGENGFGSTGRGI